MIQHGTSFCFHLIHELMVDPSAGFDQPVDVSWSRSQGIVCGWFSWNPNQDLKFSWAAILPTNMTLREYCLFKGNKSSNIPILVVSSLKMAGPDSATRAERLQATPLMRLRNAKKLCLREFGPEMGGVFMVIHWCHFFNMHMRIYIYMCMYIHR